MKRRLASCVLTLTFVASAVVAADTDEAPWTAELQAFLEQTADALRVPGAVVVVVTPDDGATVLTSGVRCLGSEEPVTGHTSFGIASLTKAFTATAAAVLVGDGVLDWDTRVRSVIPELELADPVATERVTLRDLLANRSGLGDHYLLQANVDGDPAWILPRIALVEPAGGFRDRFIYSSLGYTLAGEMIARAAGSSWRDVVSRRILEPLGMTATTIGAPRENTAEAACGHLYWRGSMSRLEPLALGVGSPGNGLYSTAEDMVRWLELLLGDGELNGRRIVAAEALRETWTPQVAIRSPGSELRVYGLGWYITSWRGRALRFHGGGGTGFTSLVRLYPEAGVAVAVLANRAASGLPDVVAERASSLVLGEPVQKDLLDVAVKMTARFDQLHEAPGAVLRATIDPDAPATLEMSDYIGCYDNPAFGRLEMRADGDFVEASFHGMGLGVEHLHDDVFLLSSPTMGDLEATFEVVDGAVRSVSLTLGNPERERIFERRDGSCSEIDAASGS